MNHTARKVTVGSFTFDSQKEAKFYEKFIQNSGYKYEVHPSYVIKDKVAIGGVNLSRISYTPDFVIFDNYGKIKHVYDVKTSINTQFGADTAAKLRFNLFARKYSVPVEVVVPRANDFKMKIYGLTKNVNTRHERTNRKGKQIVEFYDVMQSVDYDVTDFIGI